MAGDRAAKTERAEEMEGDGVPWGGEPVSGPGPGGGGMIRELIRGFGRYRRYLGRLRQNLRETQKFFRDIKCSHNHSCPSSPTGGGAEPGPAGDVAETGLPAGKAGRPEAERAGPAKWREDCAHAHAKQPAKTRKVGARTWSAGTRGVVRGHPRGRGPGEPPGARHGAGARIARARELRSRARPRLYARGTGQGRGPPRPRSGERCWSLGVEWARAAVLGWQVEDGGERCAGVPGWSGGVCR